jgi:CxxC-x17-CxxC domain-containing protein
MKKFKRNKEFKQDRDFKPARSFKSDRSGSRDFERRDERRDSRFSNDRPARRFGRDNNRPGREGGLELFDATCAKCGVDCQIPFKPRSNKPVYCRDCFRQEGDSESRDFEPRGERRESRGDRRPDSRGGGRFEPRPDTAEQLDRINKKLDKIIRSLGLD